MQGEKRKTRKKTARCIHLDTLKDFAAKFDEVAARTPSTGAEDIFETGSYVFRLLCA
jgi:hypothetical protein